ncbi:sensor histidine kinase [Pleomorphovibrio marinus]|uniref:sensor histidine kinase n=1 Tax=Pleomorphovibrio marinus TaxID=2164132 RepID=UPI000E0B17FF|nr:ATP-binding protein [Pleomorphovibrio marinus]
MIRNFSHLLVLLLLVQEANAQFFNLNRRIRGFDLTSEAIFGIQQDKKGFIWLATDKGTKYSDGISTYSLPDSLEKRFKGKPMVHADEDGHIWLYQLTGKPLVFYFDLQTWHEIPLALSEGTLQQFHPRFQLKISGSREEKKVYLSANDEVVIQLMTGELIAKFPIDKEKTGAFSSFFKKEETFLIFENIIYRVSGEELIPVETKGNEPFGAIRKVVYNPWEDMYYYLGKGFLARGSSIWVVEEVVYEGFSEKINAVGDQFELLENKGDIYFFFNSQLYKHNFRSKNTFVISAYENLKVYFVQSTFVDREGIIWLGSYRGVVNIPSLRFQNFDISVGILESDISALNNFSPGRYLLGYNNGIQVWEGTNPVRSFDFTREGEKGLGRVLNFANDDFGNVWFSAYQAGIGHYNPKTDKFEIINGPSERPFQYVYVEGDTLYAVSHNLIFKALIDANGLASSFEEALPFIKEDKANPTNFIRKIGKVDNKWVLMDNGSSLEFDGLSIQDSHIRISGYDFHPKGDTLLVGTEDGLFYIDGNGLVPYEISGQTLEQSVYVFQEDHINQLWIGTNFGVYVLANGKLRHFNERNGLIGNDINRGALCLADNQRMFIGTQNGISVYFPDEDIVSRASPLVFVENIRVISENEKDVELDKVPFQFNNVEVTYSTVSFSAWPPVTVEYMLKGLHQDWIVTENPRNNKIYFNNLPPGQYQLLIRAGLNGQNQSEVVTSKPFTVAYPLYLQGWFIALLVLFFIGLGILINFLFVQYKNQGLLKSDLVQKNAQIQVKEDQFKNVWKSSEDGLVISAVGGKVLAANPSICKMTGMNEQEIIAGGLPVLFTDPEFYSNTSRVIRPALSNLNGEALILEMTMPLKSGAREIEIHINRMMSDYEGKPLLLNVFRDITKKKEIEKGLKIAKERAEEVSRLKSSILSNMSHEIRTPLNGILGSTEHILNCYRDNLELVGQLEIIQESGERLLHTIDAILDLSRIEADKVGVVYKEININDLISKILVNLKSTAIKKGILVTLKQQTKPFIGKTSAEYLKMIIERVVGNAIKYSEKGMVEVWLEKIGQSIYIKVTDQGVGMSKEYLNRLFQPFEQESKGYNRQYEGVGLGLFITKHLLDQLSGKIDIQSEKENGTRVEITIPLG